MSIWKNISSDINIDAAYGDIAIRSKEIVFNKSKRDLLKDVVLERFKTDQYDFIINPEYGADLGRFKGRGIDTRLAEELKTALRYSLTYDDFISSQELDIVPLVLTNTIKLYVYVKIDGVTENIATAVYTSEGLRFD